METTVCTYGHVLASLHSHSHILFDGVNKKNAIILQRICAKTVRDERQSGLGDVIILYKGISWNFKCCIMRWLHKEDFVLFKVLLVVLMPPLLSIVAHSTWWRSAAALMTNKNFLVRWLRIPFDNKPRASIDKSHSQMFIQCSFLYNYFPRNFCNNCNKHKDGLSYDNEAARIRQNNINNTTAMSQIVKKI